MALEKMQGSKFESFKANELQDAFKVLGGRPESTTEPSTGKCDQIDRDTDFTGHIDAKTGKGIDSRYVVCSIEQASPGLITSI